MGMTLEEKFNILQDEYVHLMGKYQMMQADYEARLKADLMAMLEEIWMEIEEEQGTDYHGIVAVSKGSMIDIIQEKINVLKGENT